MITKEEALNLVKKLPICCFPNIGNIVLQCSVENFSAFEQALPEMPERITEIHGYSDFPDDRTIQLRFEDYPPRIWDGLGREIVIEPQLKARRQKEKVNRMEEA